MLQPSTRTGGSLLETLPHWRKCPRWALALCIPLLWLPGTAGSTLNCHKTCICASNIVSCSKMNLTTVPTGLPVYTAVLDLSYNEITRLRSEWTPVKLLKLHNLLLNHNNLQFLSSEAFVYVKHLRYLDLSSNSLQQLDEFIFEPLINLEVLLLYNNKISQIDRSAFISMIKLQKLYLSQNQISRFPLELVKEKSRLDKLSLLDLQVLPAWIKNGLYFHNNPLLCHCDLYTLLIPRGMMVLIGLADMSGGIRSCLWVGEFSNRNITMIKAATFAGRRKFN
uniref:LRRNT domain-containing protein n=1 Tax=Mola mola TaxID=94237 RepID=A0A3Q3VJ57_MOLML